MDAPRHRSFLKGFFMAESSASGVAERAPKKSSRRLSTGLMVEPVFCPTDVASPFDTVQWETRTAAIKGKNI